MSGVFKGVPAGEGLAAAHKRRVLEQLKASGKKKGGGNKGGVPAEYTRPLPVDMSRVALPAVKPWIARRVRELLGLDEDVLVGMLINTLEDAAVAARAAGGGGGGGGGSATGPQSLSPLDLHVQLEPFLEGQTTGFVRELWSLLHSASESVTGVPQTLLDTKARAMAAARGGASGGGGGGGGAVDAAAAAAAAVAAARAISLRAGGAAPVEDKGTATAAPAAPARRRSRWDVGPGEARAAGAEAGAGAAGTAARSRSRSPAPRP
jgi:hypothetical protein